MSRITTETMTGHQGGRGDGSGSGVRQVPYFERVYIPNNLGGQQDLAYLETIYMANNLAMREGFPAWRFGNTDLPVPEFEALFRVRPRGPDRRERAGWYAYTEKNKSATFTRCIKLGHFMATGSRYALWKKIVGMFPMIFKLLDKTPADANVMGNSTSHCAGVSSDEECAF